MKTISLFFNSFSSVSLCSSKWYKQPVPGFMHVYFTYSCGNMVNHSNFDIALSISNYLTSLQVSMITTPYWSIHPWWMTNDVTGHPFNTLLIYYIFVIQEPYCLSKFMFIDLLQKQSNLRRSKQGNILAAVLFLYIFLLANDYFYSNFAWPF
jgi:hypothetical protein